MEPVQRQLDPGFASLRVHRAELFESMRAMEQALAAPATGRSGAWAERVNVALVELDADFGEHVRLTEGTDGLYRSILATAPRLSSSVTGLTAEHAQITDLIRRVLVEVSGPVEMGDVDGIRESATTLLARLSRHRQRGADLVYDAYQTDIGGET